MANKYSRVNMHGLTAGKKFEESEQPVHSGMFEKSVGMFGNKSRMTPSHNPPQPHLALPEGTHTHMDARNAAHGAMAAPCFDANGKPCSIPKASSTPKSEANSHACVANLKAGFAVEQYGNAPKGMKNGD